MAVSKYRVSVKEKDTAELVSLNLTRTEVRDRIDDILWKSRPAVERIEILFKDGTSVTVIKE